MFPALCVFGNVGRQQGPCFSETRNRQKSSFRVSQKHPPFPNLCHNRSVTATRRSGLRDDGLQDHRSWGMVSRRPGFHESRFTLQRVNRFIQRPVITLLTAITHLTQITRHRQKIYAAAPVIASVPFFALVPCIPHPSKSVPKHTKTQKKCMGGILVPLSPRASVPRWFKIRVRQCPQPPQVFSSSSSSSFSSSSSNFRDFDFEDEDEDDLVAVQPRWDHLRLNLLRSPTPRCFKNPHFFLFPACFCRFNFSSCRTNTF